MYVFTCCRYNYYATLFKTITYFEFRLPRNV